MFKLHVSDSTGTIVLRDDAVPTLADAKRLVGKDLREQFSRMGGHIINAHLQRLNKRIQKTVRQTVVQDEHRNTLRIYRIYEEA